MNLSTSESATVSEIKASLAHLIGERIYKGWTFVGADVIQSKENNFFNYPNLQLNINLSHDIFSGAGELEELAMVRSVMDAVMAGYPLEEAQERRDEIEDELLEGHVAEGITSLYDLRDMPYVINATRYDYKN